MRTQTNTPTHQHTTFTRRFPLFDLRFCSGVPAYQAIYGGYVINVGDNRFPWDSRAVRENNDWVDQQRGMVAQQFSYATLFVLFANTPMHFYQIGSTLFRLHQDLDA